MAETLQKVRTRFAPSPTGFVHIGSLRTALFSFLFARQNGGVNILRIEDTDKNRFVEGSIENLLRVMRTLGIEFDEGFYLDKAGGIQERGDFGPYLQSKRLGIYQKYALELVAQGNAYYCFCTEERLEEMRKEQAALKKPPMYDRHCRNLSQSEREAKLAEFGSQGKRPVVRQAVPLEGQTVVHDLIYGEIAYEHKFLDDQVILKSDGFPTYHLAVVVDDHFMKVSHVIRGEEWIPSTPKHLLLYKALGWQPTELAHLPLILNSDKSKLSKRQGDVAVEDFLAKGYLPEALLNFVAFLGWNPKTDRELFSLDELIAVFDLKKVNKAPAVLDTHKLDWLNALYIRKLSSKELVEKCRAHWQGQGIDASKFSLEYLEAIVALEQQRLKKLSEIGERTGYFFAAPEYTALLLIWKNGHAQETIKVLKELGEFFQNLPDSDLLDKSKLESYLKNFISQHGYDNGSVLWPLRAALTGLDKSPGPFEVASVLALGLGKAEILKRLETAIGKLESP